MGDLNYFHKRKCHERKNVKGRLVLLTHFFYACEASYPIMLQNIPKMLFSKCMNIYHCNKYACFQYAIEAFAHWQLRRRTCITGIATDEAAAVHLSGCTMLCRVSFWKDIIHQIVSLVFGGGEGGFWKYKQKNQNILYTCIVKFDEGPSKIIKWNIFLNYRQITMRGSQRSEHQSQNY